MRLLIVEDDPVQARRLGWVLENCPVVPRHRATIVETLTAAVDALLASIRSADPFDCVLLDLLLPDGAGLVSYRRVAVAAPEVPVVVITGTCEREAGMALIAAGAQEFLRKGDDDEDSVCRAVGYAVERHKWRRIGRGLRMTRREVERVIEDRLLALALPEPDDGTVRDLRAVAAQLRDLTDLAALNLGDLAEDASKDDAQRQDR